MTDSFGITPLSVGDRRAVPPRSWTWRTLTSCARLESGHTPSRYHPEWWGGQIPWISLTDIRGIDGKVAQETREYTNEAGIANSAARVLPAGTVVLSRTASVGFVTIMGREMATSQDFVNWVCGPDLDPRFLAYLFRASRAYLRSLSSGAIHQTIYMPTVDAFEVCIPDLKEQKRIVCSLDEQIAAVERARAAAEAQLEAAKALSAAYLRTVLESATAQAWPRRTLAEMSEIVGGIQKSPDRVPVGFHRPYLTVRNVQRGYLDLSDVERFEVTPAEIERLRLVSGDILVVEGNGSIDQIGRNAIFVADGQEWIHQNHVIRVRLDGVAARPEFVSCFLNCDLGRAQMVKKAETTSGLYTLSAGKVASLEVPVPSLSEQERILTALGERMGQVERLMGQAGEQLAAINSLPVTLLRRAFSGDL